MPPAADCLFSQAWISNLPRIGLLVFLVTTPSLELPADEIDFVRDIRPILSDKCYTCHGPDEAQRQANLRLDTQSGAFAESDGHHAIVAGNVNDSELLRRVEANDDSIMPPPDYKKHLTEREKEILRSWIAQGASWKDHWAYLPLQEPTPPETGSSWPFNSIDQFILHKLTSQNVTPATDADRRTLIRRLSFDLIGLPPTPQQVDEFLKDPSSDAYERVVDRLLESPHYGERMAMLWLDLVRYADSVGYHGDQDVSVSPYRDYVIKAFNENYSFDRFTREQLAGDLLPNPTHEQLIASGYNKLGMMSAEGGVQPEEYLTKYASDRVRTAAGVWMGSTFGCAECHDHKFDPFTTKDFYRFAAFFADIKERGLYDGPATAERWGPIVEVPDEGLDELLAPIDSRIAELETQLGASSPEIDALQKQWQESLRLDAQRWFVLIPQHATALHQTKLAVSDDGSVLASGSNPDQNIYTLTFPPRPELLEPVRGIRIEVLPDPALPQQGPGRAGNGNFVITEVILSESNPGDNSAAAVDHLEISKATATIEQQDGDKNPYKGWKAEAAVDGDKQGASWGWAILPDSGKPNALVLDLAEPWNGQHALTITIEQNHQNPKHTLGKFRIAATHSAAPVAEPHWWVPSEIQTALNLPEGQRSAEQSRSLDQYFRKIAPSLEPIRSELAKLRDAREQLKSAHTRVTLITVAVEPRETRILKRGNWMDKTGEVVSPGVPHFLQQLPSEERRANRLDLANWLVSNNNPLTPRVFANRMWKLFFGTGLSKVLDDIGSQGEPPSHPELLDYLSAKFVHSGWDVKHLIKQIVMSHTYRQSSIPRAELQVTDPFNRLLARQSRYRLDAEMIRDLALQSSGLLVTQVGGRSVKPYQPEGLYRHLNFPARTYVADTGDNQYRRGVYTHWQRQFLHPAMQAFDAPAREECTAQRPRSNTPLSALVLLNDPSYVESARVLAQNTLVSNGSAEDRLNWMMWQVLSRSPTSEEQRVLIRLLESQIADYRIQPDAARQLIAVGQSLPSEQCVPEELAAWTSVARAILNMHETITRN